MNICIIGTGYVGLVTGACLATIGHQVVCIDHDPDKIFRLKTGDVYFYEPGLSEMVLDNLNLKRLFFTEDIGFGIENAELILIAVDTPASCDGSTDLSHVFDVATQIGKYLNSDKLVIVKSTVPVGTCAKIATIIAQMQKQNKTTFRCEVAFNPEFLKEGSAVHDFMCPDRIVIGSNNNETIDLMRELYTPIIANTSCPLIGMDLESAEITKYASNCMLATRISFMNELAKLSELTGADITKIAMGISSDRRIGNAFLQAGLGYGGSCFPKDIKSLIKVLATYGLNSGLLAAVDQINYDQRAYFIKKIKEHFQNRVKDRNLAMWGLAFKPETDDIREAPSLTIITELLAEGAIIKVFDPQARRIIPKLAGLLNNQFYVGQEQYEILKDAEALLVVTEWDCFRQPDFEKMKQLLNQPVIFDGRNIYDPLEVKKCGFAYYSIGR